MNFTPPPADALRAAIMGVVTVLFPMLDGIGLVNLDDAQLALVEVFVTSVVVLGMLFYNPQRERLLEETGEDD